MNLHDRIGWITGGARMGLEVAQVLSQAGCRIVLSYRRSRDEAEDAAEKLRAQGADVLVLRCDLSKIADIRQAVKRVVAHFGNLHILVNLSSIYQPGEWAKHIGQNATAAYNLTTEVAPAIRRSGGGRIVHIADWTSTSRRPRYKGFTGYYVSKAAIQAMVESTALELAPHVLVNAIAPGPMVPPKGMTKRELQAVTEATPLKRWGGAGEIAKAVKFLCETDFVTGETIRVDGGRHLN